MAWIVRPRHEPEVRRRNLEQELAFDADFDRKRRGLQAMLALSRFRDATRTAVAADEVCAPERRARR